VVTSSYCSRRSDHGVHASAGEWTDIANWHPIVLNERAKNIAILGEIFLCKGRHHTSHRGERHIDPCPITKPERMTDLPFGRSIRTGGTSRCARGGSTKAARHANTSGNSFTLFALATLPVAVSMSA
jgi:hypothetical protein